jgi:hypothetical protein
MKCASHETEKSIYMLNGIMNGHNERHIAHGSASVSASFQPFSLTVSNLQKPRKRSKAVQVPNLQYDDASIRLPKLFQNTAFVGF